MDGLKAVAISNGANNKVNNQYSQNYYPNFRPKSTFNGGTMRITNNNNGNTTTTTTTMSSPRPIGYPPLPSSMNFQSNSNASNTTTAPHTESIASMVNRNGTLSSQIRTQGTTAASAPPLVGRYRLIRTVGKGNFAKVKLAEHLTTGKQVAVKVIDKTKMNEIAISKLHREVQIMKQLDHPNIVKLYEVIETERHMYLIMEYCSGGELFDYLISRGRMRDSEARSTFRQILSAVQYLHQKRVVHRDLKAENLLLDNHKEIKLVDFGFSNYFDNVHKLDTFCGSPPYAAPELFKGEKYFGPEVDVWSLGVILYILITCSLPFDGVNLKELRQRVLQGRYRVPYYMTQGAENLLRKMLVLNPRKRLPLENVMRDSWLNVGFETSPLTPYCEPPQDLNDSERKAILQSMGFSEEDIEMSLTQHAFNNITATYFLLAKTRRKTSFRQPEIPTTNWSNLKDDFNIIQQQQKQQQQQQQQQQQGNSMIQRGSSTRSSVRPQAPTRYGAATRSLRLPNYNPMSTNTTTSDAAAHDPSSIGMPSTSLIPYGQVIKHNLTNSNFQKDSSTTQNNHNQTTSTNNSNNLPRPSVKRNNTIALPAVDVDKRPEYYSQQHRVARAAQLQDISNAPESTFSWRTTEKTNSPSKIEIESPQSIVGPDEPFTSSPAPPAPAPPPPLSASFRRSTTPVTSTTPTTATTTMEMLPTIAVQNPVLSTNFDRNSIKRSSTVSSRFRPGVPEFCTMSVRRAGPLNPTPAPALPPPTHHPHLPHHPLPPRHSSPPHLLSSSISPNNNYSTSTGIQGGGLSPRNLNIEIKNRSDHHQNQQQSQPQGIRISETIETISSKQQQAAQTSSGGGGVINNENEKPFIKKSSSRGEANQSSSSGRKNSFIHSLTRRLSKSKLFRRSSTQSQSNNSQKVSSQKVSSRPSFQFENSLPTGSSSHQQSPDSPDPGAQQLSDPQPRSLRFTFHIQITSSFNPRQIMQEIKNVLTTNGIDYEEKDLFLLYCVHGDDKLSSGLRWETELFRLPRISRHGVRFKRIEGNTKRFKQIVNKITSEMNL